MTPAVTTETPETRPVSRAVAILCKQFIERVNAERAELGAIAFDSDLAPHGEPASAWALDIDRACYIRLDAPTDTPTGA